MKMGPPEDFEIDDEVDYSGEVFAASANSFDGSIVDSE